MDEATRKKILHFQKEEITEYHIYKKLVKVVKNPKNKEVLQKIAKDELRHYNTWKKYTKQDIGPSKLKIWWYYFIATTFGLTFGVKLMEKTETHIQSGYDQLSKIIPAAKTMLKEENEHEKQLINMIDEGGLKYVGSVVLGLNDALVELTGALAGFSFALQDTRLVALVGSITGFAASLSMGASEYLSTKAEKGSNPIKSAFVTGGAYIITVIFLILPFLFLKDVFVSLGSTLLIALVIIFLYTFYVSVAQDVSFKKRFFEMAGISLGIATLTFGIGLLIKRFLGINI